MRASTWQRLDQELAGNPILVGGGPVPESEIAAAERELGTSFVADYAEFIMRYGGAILGGLSVYGLRVSEAMGDDDTVVTNTRHFHSWQTVRGWVVVSGDGFGNPIGIARDGRVLLSDHDAEVVDVAPSFEEFLIQLLDGTLFRVQSPAR